MTQLGLLNENSHTLGTITLLILSSSRINPWPSSSALNTQLNTHLSLISAFGAQVNHKIHNKPIKCKI